MQNDKNKTKENAKTNGRVEVLSLKFFSLKEVNKRTNPRISEKTDNSRIEKMIFSQNDGPIEASINVPI
jgi:hypothetical protein|tara:strand:- start:133 stop:339 length:207 start_codon:yes stop_codon:yes gene_type:complete